MSAETGSQPMFAKDMLTQTDTKRQLQKYLNSQNLYISIRMTAAALIPAFILYHYNLLVSAIALPLGVIFTGFTDSPGPVHHRRNSLAISILCNVVIIIIAGALHAYPPFIVAAIILFGILFSLFAIYGNRAGSVGLNALLVFIFNIDGHMSASGTALYEALLFAAGGIWYALISFVSYTLRPFKLIQQLLGECVIKTADYLRTKSGFYTSASDYENLNEQLIQQQIAIRQMQEDLREILFKSRTITEESTVKARVLMSVFLDTIDLMERIMTSQYDYKELHSRFRYTDILSLFGKQIDLLADELYEAGLALQSGRPTGSRRDLDVLQQQSMNAFLALRKKTLNEDTIEDFIVLRQILFSLEDITERIERLRFSTRYDAKTSKEYTNDVDIKKFITHSEVEPRLLLNNLTLESANFRHAVRLTAGLLIGYAISLFFPLGHSYWILLTTAVIIKPAYSITRKRNLQRVAGTITGAVLGFLILYTLHDKAALFIVMIITMVIAYSFVRVNYFIGSAGITVYVLLSFSFLSSAGFQHALNDRLIDTLIGSAIAWLVAIFVLPNWEHKQIDEYIVLTLKANQNYFDSVAQAFTGKPVDTTTFKLHRKDAFVALANLSDAFQRMMSEPKNRQVKMRHYHQFVATSHTLTSYIASLSYYAQRHSGKYISEGFIPVITQINKQFQMANDVLEHHQPAKASQMQPLEPVTKKIEQLLAERRQEISTGETETETSVRRTLSDLKMINDQFKLISTATVDEVRILEKISN